ncbi:MAG: bifunctional DNA-formamidopyrimidine glycosylase/DNA-(apurinic or apyrimidinic site) lyase [Candidatus Wallbacteria bacterium]|nr:bifunctional DNA-formamidopyrimidine glycosylase/DNA-(apurinic or apyrimidinic site) lyase [Candidatus Wallbacteria bacterium]
MPELPEVETIVRGLCRRIIGRQIKKIEIRDRKLDAFPSGMITGRCIKQITRRGKYILMDVGLPKKIVFHLRMTGALLVRNDVESLKYLRLIFHLNQEFLVLEDKRRFATADLMQPEAIEKKLGPEPLSDNFTLAYLAAELKLSKMNLKSFLLDQKRIAGIGNIYASEIAFAAEIDPERKTGTLNARETVNLYRAVVQILNLACELRGTTFSDYRDTEGRSGGFQEQLTVFRKNGSPCPRCGAIIRRKVIGQRSTFFCHSCQK